MLELPDFFVKNGSSDITTLFTEQDIISVEVLSFWIKLPNEKLKLSKLYASILGVAMMEMVLSLFPIEKKKEEKIGFPPTFILF